MSSKPSHNPVASEAEPTSRRAASPLWAFILLGLLLYWGMVYVDAHSGGFDTRVYEPYHSFAELKAMQPVSDENPLFARGRNVYQTCAACHQASGLGSTTVHAPPLVGAEWVLDPGPNRLIRIVLDGLKGPIEVKGQQFGQGVMTPFRDSFSDEDIAAVLTYIRQNRDWGHNASAVTPAQVQAVREATKGRAGINWTAQELLSVPPGD